MKKIELVFIPSPGLSHLISTVEMAKILISRDDRLAVTMLIMKLPNDTVVSSYTDKITTTTTASSSGLRLIHLPGLDDGAAQPRRAVIHHDFIDKQATHVREAISNLIEKADSQLAGLVLDLFCSKFVEIGCEFGLPSYVYCASSVACLGLSQHWVEMRSEYDQTLANHRDSDVELHVRTYSNRVPAKVLPTEMKVGGAAADEYLRCFEKIPEMNGIIANTFYELESYAIDVMNSDASKSPKIYPVGPILHSDSRLFEDEDDDVKKWLDDQDEESVVFLCFGSMGRMEEAQVREISLALEKSECRFLWSLRDHEKFLPGGFLERTKGAGKVIGWAAQVAVLAHAAVGGFVSHCGWNSILESVWFGVPIATFPLYAEQQMNAFQLVKELGMAEMIRLDSKMGWFEGEAAPEIVGAEEIAAAIRRLMAAEGLRVKVKEMQMKAREALERGGTSFDALNLFIENVVGNISFCD